MKVLDLFKKKPEEFIDYQEIRQEQLSLISKIIKEKRLELNYSIDLISNHLHIPISILNSIESADLSHLPEPVFTKQLLKKYADYLKLNGNELTANFTIEINKKITNQKSTFKGIKLNLRVNLKPQHLYIFYFILLFFAVNSLSTILQSSLFSQTKIPQKKVIETNTKTSPDTPPTVNPPQAIPIVEKKEETSTKPKPPEELKVKVVAKDECWVKVLVDDKPVFEGILTKGLEKEWVGKQKVTIRAGNAGGLMVSVNDEKPTIFGKAGQVQENTYELPTRS